MSDNVPRKTKEGMTGRKLSQTKGTISSAGQSGGFVLLRSGVRLLDGALKMILPNVGYPQRRSSGFDPPPLFLYLKIRR
jgi:hypothetical protein